MDVKRGQPATTAVSTNQTSTEPLPSRTVQNCLVVWVDQNMDENNNQYKESIKLLRNVVNTIKTFANADECIDFISRNRTEKIFLIASGTLGQKTVPIVHDMIQVNTIYIFCGNKARHEEWVQKYPKIKDISTGIQHVYKALEKAVRECNHNIISISFMTTSNDVMNKKLDQFDQTFVYTRTLKEILLTMNFGKDHQREFLIYSRLQFVDNEIELSNIAKFEKHYCQQRAIHWYIYPGFISSMLNRALYKLEVDLIMKLGFFIRDLHEYITQLHVEQYAGRMHSGSFMVYRGQGLSHKDFNQLMKLQDGLLSFNSFLSASKHQAVSLDFAHKAMENLDLIGVLFVMNIDSSMPSTPFADIHGMGCDHPGEEILFSMHSIFRIGQMKNINDNKRLWEVNLTLVSNNDPQLRALTEHIQEETYSHAKGWYRLGDLSIKLNQFDKAQQVFLTMLNQTYDSEQAGIYHKLGMIKEKQEKYAEAIPFYKKWLEINQQILPPTHPDLCSAYNSLGQMYEKTDQLSKALSRFEKVLGIQQQILPPNHPDLIKSYTNLGNVYKKMGNYLKALEFHEKVYKIYQKTLPPNHPDLATAYYNIGDTHNLMGNYSKAMPLFEKAVTISEAANTPDLQKWRKDLESVKQKL
jgi:tetratricopeptide (TPR) repeat protein